MDEALRAWTRALGPDAVVTGPALTPWLENAGGARRQVPAALRPRSLDEVVTVVRIARQYRAPVHPISRGRNWGMGSRLPVRDGAAILDLSRMDRIREISVGGRYAVIEPGVTQSQLHRRLAADQIPLMFNVTGSGLDTSLLGNALDRGVGYFGSRAEALSGLEVVLGTGEVIRTGFGHWPQARTTHLYRHGVGPSLDGLFAQGNAGIVTAAGFELLPRPESDVALVARLDREEALPEVIGILADLRRRGAIAMVAHVANRERSLISLAPLLLEELRRLEAIPSGADARTFTETLLRREGFGPWSVVAALPGRGARLAWARREVRRALGQTARVRFLGGTAMRRAEAVLTRLSRFAAPRARLAMLRAIRPLRGLAVGIPTDAPLEGVYWPVPGSRPDDPADPDASDAGLLYALPLLPADASDVRACLDGTRRIFTAHGFEPAITLNLLDDRCLEGVISLAFPRTDPDRVRAGRACIREAERFYLDAGWPPYRVGIDSMDLLTDPDDPYWRIVRDLKNTLDPDHIIAPGRYNLD